MTSKLKALSAGLGLLGLALCMLAGFTGSANIWNSYLWGFAFWLQFPMGAIGFLLLHNIVGGNWGRLIRPLLVGGARSLPVMILFLIPLLVAVRHLYPWAAPNAHELLPHLHKKEKWLNVSFFEIRAVFYVCIWMFLAWRLSSDKKYTVHGADVTSENMRNFSSVGMVVFITSLTFAVFDWIMSQEPDWFSTVFGLIFFISCGLATMSFCVLFTSKRLRREAPAVQEARKPVFHDLGNLMLALTMLWAYLSFFQFLIIYCANLPEEVVYYTKRIENGWALFPFILVPFGFFAPFMFLLMRGIKKSFKWLPYVAVFSLLMRMVDLYFVIIPPRRPHFTLTLADLGAFLGIGGIWLALFLVLYRPEDKQYALPANFGGSH